MKKTKAIAILEQAGVSYELRSFAAQEFTAEEAARELNLPLSMLFKTLVVQGKRRGVALAVVPGDRPLSLGKLAQAMGDKRVELVDLKDLTRLTGYVKGGASPLGARRPYPVYLDRSALRQAQISISAGKRGLQILLAPGDLVRVAEAAVVDLAD